MSPRLAAVLCLLLSLASCEAARTLLDSGAPSPQVAPLFPEAEFAPHAAPAAYMEALSGSISAAILDSIKSFKERAQQRSPCEQLSRNAALRPVSSSSQAAGPSDRPAGAFFFRDPSIRVSFLGPASGTQYSPQQQQGPGLVQPAPAQAEGTGVLPLNGMGPSLQDNGSTDSSSQTALPCTDLPINIFAALARDGYVRK